MNSNNNNQININGLSLNMYQMGGDNINLGDLKHKIDNLTEIQLQEIFRIILKHDEKYTVNTYGIFVNLTAFKKNTINDINNYLIFCENNEKFLNDFEQNTMHIT